MVRVHLLWSEGIWHLLFDTTDGALLASGRLLGGVFRRGRFVLQDRLSNYRGGLDHPHSALRASSRLRE